MESTQYRTKLVNGIVGVFVVGSAKYKEKLVGAIKGWLLMGQ